MISEGEENWRILFELLEKPVDNIVSWKGQNWYKQWVSGQLKLQNPFNLVDFGVYFLDVVCNQLQVINARFFNENKQKKLEAEILKLLINYNLKDENKVDKAKPSSSNLIVPEGSKSTYIDTCQKRESVPVIYGDPLKIAIIMKLSIIYTVIMDENLTVNFLSEIGFLVDLLNTTQTASGLNGQLPYRKQRTQFTCDDKKDVNVCIVQEKLDTVCELRLFAVNTLAQNVQILSALDDKTLSILIRAIGNFHRDYTISYDHVYNKLLSALRHKKHFRLYGKHFLANLEPPLSLTFTIKDLQETVNCIEYNTTCCRLFTELLHYCQMYQDIFHQISRENELKDIIMSDHIVPRIHKIFHSFTKPDSDFDLTLFVKYFVKSLLLSTLETVEVTHFPAKDLNEITETRLAKCRQLLLFKDVLRECYDFPNIQRFYYITIIESQSIAFIAYLNKFLYDELLKFLDAIEVYDLMKDASNPKTQGQNNSSSQCIPIYMVVNSILFERIMVLAKFYGLTVKLLSNLKKVENENYCTAEYPMNILIEKNTPVNIYTLVCQSLKKGQLLLTLPWLVQYFSVLDYIDIQSPDNYRTIHLMLTVHNIVKKITPKSKIIGWILQIILLPLGWLLEQEPKLSEIFYKTKATAATTLNGNYQDKLGDDTQYLIETFLFKSIEILNETKYANSVQEDRICELLETQFVISCPFLELFRINALLSSLIHVNMSPQITRDGTNLFHKYADDYRSIVLMQNCRRLLSDVEALNRSLIYRLIDYCVKYCQPMHPVKKKGPNESELNVCKDTIKSFLYSMFKPECIHWANSNLTNRLRQEMSCILLTLHQGLIICEFYVYVPLNMVKEIQIISRKMPSIEPGKLNTTVENSNLLIISPFKPELISKDTLDNIHEWIKWSLIVNNGDDIYTNLNSMITFLEKVVQNLNITMNTNYNLDLYSDIGSAIIKLIQSIIAVKSNSIDSASIGKIFVLACQIFMQKDIKIALSKLSSQNAQAVADVNYTDDNMYDDAAADDDNIIKTACKADDKDNACLEDTETNYHEQRHEQRLVNDRCSLTICNQLITVDFIKACENNPSSFDHFAELLILITKNFSIATIDHVNEMFLKVFAYDWQTTTYAIFSNLLGRVAAERKNKIQPSQYDGGEDARREDDDSDVAKSILFMDLLSDLSKDIGW